MNKYTIIFMLLVIVALALYAGSARAQGNTNLTSFKFSI